MSKGASCPIRCPLTAREWTPILAGEEAARALAIVREIAESFDHATETLEGGLYNGLAGLALLHGHLGCFDGNDDHQARAVELLAAATSRLGDPPQVGLAWGVAGIAWVTHHLHELGIEDLDVDASLDEFLADQVSVVPWDHPYDLMDGLAGIGLAVLARHTEPDARRIAVDVLTRFEELVVPRPIGATLTFMPPDSRGLGNPEQSLIGPAHGVSGVIAVLARYVELDLERTRARRLLEALVAWLLAQRMPDGPNVFPTAVREGRASRGGAGWCHGDPGIATALLVAARRAGHPALEAVAHDTLATAIADPRTAQVPTAHLCHGSAGFAHMFNRAFHHTADPRFRAIATPLYTRTITRWERERSNVLPLLQGTVGIALVLLAGATGLEPTWDRAFVMS